MPKKKIVALGLFVALLAAATGMVFAAKDTGLPAQAGCNLSRGKLDELKFVQENPDIDYVQRTTAELKIRKALLKEAAGCAIEEAAAIKSGLTKTEAREPEAESLKKQFLGRLEDALNYYELQKSKIEDLGLQGSRNFARELKEWRDGNYKPAAKLASNFIIWAQNQELLQSAQNRLDQIASTVSILKLVYNEDIQNLWRGADQNFNEARKANQEAKLNLRASLPDEALNSIKSSLTALAKTYGNLFDLFAGINKSLKP